MTFGSMCFKTLFYIYLFAIYLECVHAQKCVQPACEGQKLTCGCWLSRSTRWVLGT